MAVDANHRAGGEHAGAAISHTGRTNPVIPTKNTAIANRTIAMAVLSMPLVEEIINRKSPPADKICHDLLAMP